MYVKVNLDTEAGSSVSLEEADDCSHFHVEVRGSGQASALDEALEDFGVGFVDADGGVMVCVDAVRSMAAGRVEENWAQNFAAMLEYAHSKGWLSEDGQAIRAHIEWR